MQRFTRRNIFSLNLLAVIIGIVAGYGAIGFRHLLGFLGNLFVNWKISINEVSFVDHQLGWWIILLPAMGLPIAAWVSQRFAPEAKGAGISEVMEAVLCKYSNIRKRVFFIKALASALTIGSGGSAGREGPIVQIGASVASTVGTIFKIKKAHRKILLGCGAAAAISATFNTPIAGVVFAVELIVLELRAKSFIPLVISSVLACMISRWYLGDQPAFLMISHTFIHPLEIVFYLGLGLLAGLLGVIFINVFYTVDDLFKAIPWHYLVKALLGGLIIGGIGYVYPHILGTGYHTVNLVLKEQLAFELMLVLVIVKMFAVSVTIGAGGAGGVFAPSLFMGAMLGGTYGMAINHFFPSFSAGYGAYALVGMAALLSSASRATFTAIVTLFELTLDYSIILPLMFACVVADQVAHLISKNKTIFSVRLQQRGLHPIEGFGVNIYEVTPISQVMTSELTILATEQSLADVRNLIGNCDHEIYPVTTIEGVLMGMVRRKDIEQGENEALVSSIMIGTPGVVYPEDTVLHCLTRLTKSRDPRLLVVDPSNKKLLGMVTPTDLVRLSSQEAYGDAKEDIL